MCHESLLRQFLVGSELFRRVQARTDHTGWTQRSCVALLGVVEHHVIDKKSTLTGTALSPLFKSMTVCSALP